jgi:hypothetical protein
VDDLFGQARTAPPNIVFIMADDLGYADAGCYGRSDLRRPNIDRIATKGVRFLQFRRFRKVLNRLLHLVCRNFVLGRRSFVRRHA